MNFFPAACLDQVADQFSISFELKAVGRLANIKSVPFSCFQYKHGVSCLSIFVVQEAFSSEDALQPATESAAFAFDDEEEQAPWLSVTAGQDDAAASAGQPDDIFGPAHEFD